jgi:hypothetical protein
MKSLFLLSFLVMQLALAQYEATAPSEQLYYRGTINDATFQLELTFNYDVITGKGYDEQGNELYLQGRLETENNTVMFTDSTTGYAYLAAFVPDETTQSYSLNGVRINTDGSNKPFTLRLVATYASVAFRTGTLESTLSYPLWVGNYKIFNRVGTEDLQNHLVATAFDYFKEQQRLGEASNADYRYEPISRNAVTEIYFASPELVSLLVRGDDYNSIPLESINLLAENGNPRRLVVSDLVADNSNLLELVATKLEQETKNEDISLTAKALEIFTLSTTKLTFYIPTDEVEMPYSFQNSYIISVSFDELEGNINSSILETLR